MQRWQTSLAAIGLTILTTGVSAQNQIQIQVQVQPAPLAPLQGRLAVNNYASNRLANSDAILVGRVVALEPMDMEAAPAKGQPKLTYRIGVIQVTESLHGLAKDAKMVRVGFVVAGDVPPGAAPGNLPVRMMRRPFESTMQLQSGQDGLFFLARHAEGSFYVSPMYQNFISRQNSDHFEHELKSAKNVAKFLANPAAFLKSADKDERYTAAAILISRYRNSNGLPVKQVAIDAGESKLIMKALAEADWINGQHDATIPNPTALFQQLGIGANDGYRVVGVVSQQEAMQKWIADNAGKYVIKKLVYDENGTVPEALPAQPAVIRRMVVPPPQPLPKNE